VSSKEKEKNQSFTNRTYIQTCVVLIRLPIIVYNFCRHQLLLRAVILGCSSSSFRAVLIYLVAPNQP